jgi:homospermidine synthase
MPDQKHARFGGHLAIVAVGSIGQGVLPLLLRHLDIRPFRRARLRGVTIADSSTPGRSLV